MYSVEIKVTEEHADEIFFSCAWDGLDYDELVAFEAVVAKAILMLGLETAKAKGGDPKKLAKLSELLNE